MDGTPLVLSMVTDSLEEFAYDCRKPCKDPDKAPKVQD